MSSALAYRRVHMVGAAGAGMSAIAKVLAAMGHELSASDLRGGHALDSLAELGVETRVGHGLELAVGADLVVASSAVPDADPELMAAASAGIPVWRRPQLLAAITSQMPTIGATGTHGKTTTTALIVTALRATGLDPSFILGGDLVDAGTNGHLGEELLVLEADEAFRTFEALHLRGLVVTNVEAEHLEHFGTESDLVESFINVASRVEGPVLACLDDDGSARVAAAMGAITYGTDPRSSWRIDRVEPDELGVSFTLTGAAGRVGVSVPRPGAHVARDAAGALALLAELGHDLEVCASGLSRFRGVTRRWEHRGTVGGVVLIDDYAHHPTEVAASLAAARGRKPSGRLWAVFQPHLYSRTQRFFREFGRALASGDVVVVTDVYGSREAPVPGVTGALVADAAAENGADVRYVPHRSDLAAYLVDRVQAGDLVITMGAGDITLLSVELAGLLGERART